MHRPKATAAPNQRSYVLIVPDSNQPYWNDMLQAVEEAERFQKMTQTVQYVMAALTSWAVGLLAIFGTYSDQITKGLAMVLVIARLVQEVPKAIKFISDWRRRRRMRHDNFGS